MALPTVKEVREFLAKFPDDALVWAYEGEGGASINVRGRSNVGDELGKFLGDIGTNDYD